MYKGKVGYWVTIISIVLVIQFCLSIVFPWVGSWFDSENIMINANTSHTDSGFFEVLGDTSIGDFNYLVDSKNPDIYFSDSSEGSVKEGYTKYSNYLYSPLVLFVRYDVYDNASGFSRIDPQLNSSSPLQIDLYDILVAVEKNQEWKDIGISTQVVKGPVVLTIPNERSPYFEAVVDLFYMTLNNLKEPTETEYEELTPRVLNILNKCEKISDVSQGMISEYDKHSVNYKVFIGPEFLYTRGGEETGRSYDDQFVPIYFMNTIFIKMDMYVNENIQEEDRKIAVEKALNAMSSERGFYEKTGWRIVDSYLDMSHVSYSLANTVSGY